MINYKEILYSMTVGKERTPLNRFTKQDCERLIQEISKNKGIPPTKNGCFENSQYFMYIGEFPSYHIAIDNKIGTSRIFSIFNMAEYKQILPKIK